MSPFLDICAYENAGSDSIRTLLASLLAQHSADTLALTVNLSDRDATAQILLRLAPREDQDIGITACLGITAM